MKNKLQLWFFAILCFYVVSILSAQDTKQNVAVLDLDPTGIPLTDAQFLSDRLRTELFETGRFQIVERSKMNNILTEQGFQQSGCTSVECAVEIGQLLNVSAIVAGSIGRIEDLYSISIRLIDVESGAILKTATRDFEGKLSEVLTDVIPDVTSDLASTEYEEAEITQDSDKEKIDSDFNRFAILLKAGLSTLQYTTDINKSINNLDASLAENIDELPNHSNFGLEGQYALSPRWKLKFGLSVENLLSSWQISISNSVLFQELTIKREYQFINSYIGINYLFWQKPKVSDFYLGIDIGSTSFNSRLKQSLIALDDSHVDQDNSYQYNKFTWKFTLGGVYYISSSFSVALEFAAKIASAFDTTDQIPRDVDPELSPDIIYPEEVNSSGIQFNLYIGYHF